MNQYSQRREQQSRGGCGRIAMIGGGCLLVVVLGFVGIIVAGSLFWDRGTEAGGNFVSNWATERFGTDISDRAAAVEEVTADLPEARDFEDRDSYLAFIDAYHREFAAAMERVADLVGRPQLQDDEWADGIAQEIALIRHLEEEAKNVSPPGDFSQAHEYWVTGMGEYRQAIDSTASAMDNVSPSQLAEAISSLTSATRSYISMAETLDEMGALDDLESLEELRNIEQQQ